MSRADRVGIAAQTDIDTIASAPSYGIPVEAESINLNRDTIDINETLGSRGPTTSEYGVRFLEGSMSGAVRPVSFPLLLAAYMGEPVSAEVITGVHTHTFDPLAITYPVPLTVYGVNKDPSKVDAGTLETALVNKFIGAVGNQMTLSAEVNNYVRFEGTMASKSADVDDTSEPSITQDTSRKWVFNQVKVEMDVAPIASYLETYAGSFSFVFNNNLITDLGRLGSNTLTDIPLGPEIESTLTVAFQRNMFAHYRSAFEDSPTQVALKITAEGATITGAHKFTFSLEFPYLETVGAPIERSGSDTLREVEVTFNVVTDPTTSKMVTPIIKNATDGALYTA